MPIVLSFEGFGKSFETRHGAIEATRNIDLQVRQGEFITILGPSGCGKSTLLNAAAGLIEPTAGRALYRGEPVSAYNQSVGYMTQSDYLLPWRVVADNIALPLEIKGVPKAERTERVRELVALVRLEGFERSYPSQISGGMRKRTALARLMAQGAETLLLDEPFAALDAQLRLAMQGELRRLVRDMGKTVLFVTHDLDEAVALGDRCVVFTRRPGTISEICEIPLPADRDLFRLRSDADYVALTADLWSRFAPSVETRSE